MSPGDDTGPGVDRSARRLDRRVLPGRLPVLPHLPVLRDEQRHLVGRDGFDLVPVAFEQAANLLRLDWLDEVDVEAGQV